MSTIADAAATSKAKVGSADRPSLIMKFAAKYNIVPDTLLATLKATCFKSKTPATNEQMVALLIVADQFNLNPFTKEIYAYPDKFKGIVPVVSIDGWIRIINEHPQYNGFELFESESVIEGLNDDGTYEHAACFAWCGIKFFRKGIEHTPMIKEYFDECYRAPSVNDEGVVRDGPWQTHPKRLLRWKTMIQGARATFGFAGIYDDDEAERIVAAQASMPDPVQTQTGGAVDANSRTSAAADALRAKGISNQAGTGGLEGMKVEQRETVASIKTRASEWDDPPKTAAMDESEPYSIPAAIDFLRLQKKQPDLKNAWKMISDSYRKKQRDVPIDIEAFYGDRKEFLEQQQ